MEIDLTNKNILVIGDIMLDRYIIGEVERISPEAPVPILHVQKEYSTLGGCGNTVRNIRELGANVSCLSAIGLDREGDEIINLLSKIGVNPDMLSVELSETIVKERIIASERKIQMLRIDRERIQSINFSDTPKTCLKNNKIKYDIIIISDYAKGMITEELMQYLYNSYSAPIIVDPKPQNFNFYKDVFMITPNEKEWRDIISLTFPSSIENVFMITPNEKEWRDIISLTFPSSIEYVLLTQGGEGMILIDNKDNSYTKIASEKVEVYNVSGAGDTVISIMAICLSMGLNVVDSSFIANKCAAYVITQSTTATVPKKVFFEIFKKYRQGGG